MGEGLAQGLYVAVRVGFEPATLRTQGSEVTTEPPRILLTSGGNGIQRVYIISQGAVLYAKPSVFRTQHAVLHQALIILKALIILNIPPQKH